MKLPLIILRYFCIGIATLFVLNWSFDLLTAPDTFLNAMGAFLLVFWGLLLLSTKLFTFNPFKRKSDNANNTDKSA
jgi:hypothetical protein